MIRCVYVDRFPAESEWSTGFDCRMDVSCGASVGGGRPPCDASRAVVVLSSGAVFIYGPPAHTFHRPPGANDWDGMEKLGSLRPDEGHEIWVGYGPESFDPQGLPLGQAFWKIRFRGCPEHDDAAPHYVTTTELLCAAADQVSARDLRIALSINDLERFVQPRG